MPGVDYAIGRYVAIRDLVRVSALHVRLPPTDLPIRNIAGLVLSRLRVGGIDLTAGSVKKRLKGLPGGRGALRYEFRPSLDTAKASFLVSGYAGERRLIPRNGEFPS